MNGAVGVGRGPARPAAARSLGFTIAHGKIAAIDVVADPERLRQLDLAVL